MVLVVYAALPAYVIFILLFLHLGLLHHLQFHLKLSSLTTYLKVSVLGRHLTSLGELVRDERVHVPPPARPFRRRSPMPCHAHAPPPIHPSRHLRSSSPRRVRAPPSDVSSQPARLTTTARRRCASPTRHRMSTRHADSARRHHAASACPRRQPARRPTVAHCRRAPPPSG